MVNCDKNPSDPSCETGVSTSEKTIIPLCIFLGIFVIGTLVVIFMYQRRKRMNRLEDARASRMRDSTFGLDETMPYPHNGPAPAVASSMPARHRRGASGGSLGGQDFSIDPDAKPQYPRHMV